MSKGNPIVKVRIPAELVAEIEAEIKMRNFYTRNEPWDFSGFLRAAIAEFKRKRRASRGERKRTAGRVSVLPAAE